MGSCHEGFIRVSWSSVISLSLGSLIRQMKTTQKYLQMPLKPQRRRVCVCEATKPSKHVSCYHGHVAGIVLSCV